VRNPGKFAGFLAHGMPGVGPTYARGMPMIPEQIANISTDWLNEVLADNPAVGRTPR
jgi:hypothetical protein